MLKVRHPATIVDLANLGRAMDPLSWHVLRTTYSKGQSFALDWNGETMAMAVLFPLPDGGWEASFNFSPMAQRHMLSIVRQVRLTLADPKYSGCVTLCTTTAGKRLAHLCGFIRVTDTQYGEVWAHGGTNQRAFRRQNESPSRV